MNSLFPLALLAGAAIAIQATMNSSLGLLLKNPLFSTMSAFLVSCLIINLTMLFFGTSYPTLSSIQSVPTHLWLSGILSAFGVGMVYYLIPKMGAGSLMSYVLTGQMVVAMLASHFGWFELPQKQITHIKLVGVATLIAGILLVNWEN
ncbi:DMT family transporter [Marinomonas agarivorans]|nr:DMT family transporter [Marinomonas agarivorans]